MRVSDDCQSGRFKEDAYSKRARIIRLKSDLTTEIVNVNLEALEGDLEADIALNKRRCGNGLLDFGLCGRI
jgi:hypothetical protein